MKVTLRLKRIQMFNTKKIEGLRTQLKSAIDAVKFELKHVDELRVHDADRVSGLETAFDIQKEIVTHTDSELLRVRVANETFQTITNERLNLVTNVSTSNETKLNQLDSALRTIDERFKLLIDYLKVEGRYEKHPYEEHQIRYAFHKKAPVKRVKKSVAKKTSVKVPAKKKAPAKKK